MFQDLFKQHIAKFSTVPFLFIGSGFSRRYLNLPAWEDLLKEMVIRLELPKPYDYYRANAANDLPTIASLMGEDFNEKWWNDDLYRDSRAEFAKDALSRLSPLKYEICKRLKENSQIIQSEILEHELRLLKKVNIDGIITTNWDRLIEDYIFPDFRTYVGQDELIFSDTINIGEIYKIHGSIDSPNSLVLTKEDYDEYHNKNTYLAAKLLTIFIERPVIFIGYSLNDTNIHNILKAIIACISKEKVDLLKDHLIFCQWDSDCANPTIVDSTMLISKTIIPIKLVTLANYIDIYTVLANNKRRIPTKILRHMKDMIYDFVKTTDSKQKIYIADSLDNIEDIHKAEFVWGIGLKDKLAEHGIKGVDLKDLLKDVVLNDHPNWNPETIAKLALPTLSMRGRFIPYYKYLRTAHLLDRNNEIDANSEVVEFTPDFITKVNRITRNDFLPPESYQRKKDEVNGLYGSFNDLLQGCGDNALHIMMYTPLLSAHKLPTDELGDYLRKNIELINNSQYGTHFRRLICLYDYLKYKEQI